MREEVQRADLPHRAGRAHAWRRQTRGRRCAANWRARRLSGQRQGQKLYPRFEMFLKITDVFRQSGRSVPVFNDKHLSCNWRQAKRMVEISRELRVSHARRLLGARRLADSGHRHTIWRDPEVRRRHLLQRSRYLRLPCARGTAVHGGAAKGGETGVRSVQCLQNQDCWNFIEQNGWAKRLFEEALSHSNTRKPGNPQESGERARRFRRRLQRRAARRRHS